MSTDLRDQLQKLGLVSAADVQAQDSKSKGQRKSTGSRRKGGSVKPKPSDSRGKKATGSKPAGNESLTEPLKTAVSDSLPPKQRVMELIKQHSCNDKRSQSEYFFTDSGGVVRSVIANKTQQQQLAVGALVVVKPQQNRDPYVLIPANVATVVIELMPQRIVLWHGEEQRLKAAQTAEATMN